MRPRLNLAAAIALFCPLALTAQEKEYPNPNLLAEPAGLAETSAAERPVILDARGRDAFREAHVPGALWVDPAGWRTAFGDGTDAQEWGRLIGSLGIDADSEVVVYDDNRAKDAARIWWILRYWGVEDAKLLNGGWQGWTAAGLPTEKGAPRLVEPVTFRPEPLRERFADKGDVLESLKEKTLQIVDARSEDEHCGIDRRDNRKAGAIPDAKHLEWSDLIEPKTHRFKGPEEIRRLFAEAGIDVNRPSVTHCEGGGRASVMAFGLELMGAERVRNYYKGWAEWGNAEDTPVQIKEKKDKR